MAKKNKCCGLPWVDSKCECTLNDILLKLLPAGHPSGNYEIVSDGDGNYDIISSSSSTPTPATMVDNGDLTLTFNNGVNPPVTFNAKKTAVVDNGNGTFTLTDDFGTTVTIDTNDVVTTLVNNPNKTFTYTNELAVPVTVDYKIATIVNNGDKTFNYTDDFGNTGVIDTNDVVTLLVNNSNGSFTYTNELAAPVTIDFKRTTITNNNNGTFTYVDDFGNTGTISVVDVLTVYTSTALVPNKIGEYKDELGVTVDVFENLTSIAQSANGDIAYTNEAAVLVTSKILSTDANQLLKSGSDKGNLVTATDLISIDANNTIVAGADGKLFAPIVSVFPDDQVFNGIATDTTTIALTPLAPTLEGQINYNLEVNVKTQCEINSDASGIKLSDGFYENIGTVHITTLPTLTAFDPNKQVKQVNIVKNGCSLKAFVNKDEEVFVKFHGVSDINLNVLTNISIGGVAPDVISIIVTSLAANFDFSNWYINVLSSGKKVGQKFIVALDINTPLFSMTYDHANAGLVKSIFDKEILTVKALEVDTLYED